MDKPPTLDEFQRHLQSELAKCEDIDDAIHRRRRLVQLEAAIQEAIQFQARWRELSAAGVDPITLDKAVRLVARSSGPMDSTTSDGVECIHCSAVLDGEIEFCTTCGKFQKKSK